MFLARRCFFSTRAAASSPLMVNQLKVGVRGHSLAVCELFQQSGGDDQPLLLLHHGAVESGSIFVSSHARPEEKKGFAPFMAQNGFRVFVADARGRGKSEPLISSSSSPPSLARDHGQAEMIEDMLALHAFVRSQRPQSRAIVWGAHSWGAVIMSAAMIRASLVDLTSPGRTGPRFVAPDAQVFFGSKRSIVGRDLRRRLVVDLGWNIVGPLAVSVAGYLPAKLLGMGSDNETKRSLRSSIQWVNDVDHWADDPDDAPRSDGLGPLDYRAALKQLVAAGFVPPPTLNIAADADHVLGNPVDVARFAHESGADLNPRSRLLRIGRSRGNLHDYSHIDMLVHRDAVRDHFPAAVAFLRDVLPQC